MCRPETGTFTALYIICMKSSCVILSRILKEEGKCPMCGENVDWRRLVKIDDVAAYMDLNTGD